METNQKFYLTKETINKIQQEYEDLKKKKHEKVGGRDDFPEVLHSEELNPDYLYFLEELKLLEKDINKMAHILKNSEEIKPSNRKKGVVDVGATVLFDVGGQEDQFTVVETLEADPDSGRISKESPVGKAFLNSKEGDEVTVSSPVKTTYKIKKIKYHFS